MAKVKTRKMVHKKGKRVSFWFTLFGICLILAMILLILPKVEINIFVQTEMLNSNFDLKLDVENNEVDLVEESIPVKQLVIEKLVKSDLSADEVKYNFFKELVNLKLEHEKLSYDLIKVNFEKPIDDLKKAKITAYYFNKEDLEEIINNRMSILLPANKQFLDKNHKVNYTVKEFKPVDNLIILNVNLQNFIIDEIDEYKIKDMVLESNKQEILAYFSENYQDLKVEYKSWPISDKYFKKFLTSQRIYINIITQ